MTRKGIETNPAANIVMMLDIFMARKSGPGYAEFGELLGKIRNEADLAVHYLRYLADEAHAKGFSPSKDYGTFKREFEAKKK